MDSDFLLSLHKLLHWLLAFLMALLPQHLMSQLSSADFAAVPAYTTTAFEARVAPDADAARRPVKEVMPVRGSLHNAARRVHLER